ncbi:CYTH and CHAD domain-containing protein [Staphylococcus chromogenes]|nr:CYTH and CHAD domain-containing protein [Staphylococcus chromogenes]
MATSTSLEVEAKFSATSDIEVPDLTAIVGVHALASSTVHHLSARYFDTADLRLTRAKITLRRRTGGKDAGWHLKLPAETGRIEVAVPLADDDSHTPPAEILEQVRAIVRDLPLSPIAQVDNERHESLLADEAGAVVAEFCDDHVTAWSLLSGGRKTQWREWEVELAGDNPHADLLDSAKEVLLAAGATESDSPSKLKSALGDSIHNAPTPPQMADLDPASAAHAVINAIRVQRDRLIEVDPMVRRDEWDSVHQMRVATRELRSLMQTFEGILVGDEYTRVEAELKLLAGVLSVARDAEVVAERFQMLLGLDDDDLVDEAATQHLSHDMQQKYARAHRSIMAALNSERYFSLLASLENLIAHPPLAEAELDDAAEVLDDAPVHADEQLTLFGHLEGAYRKLMKRHRKALDEWEQLEIPLRVREENFHNMRKAAKKLRYSADAVGRATDVNTKDLYAACKTMQSVLGDFQDSVTSRDELLNLAKRARTAGEDTFGYGALYQRERAIGLQALADYAEAAKDIEKAYKKLDKAMEKATTRAAAKAESKSKKKLEG